VKLLYIYMLVINCVDRVQTVVVVLSVE